ncbi:hypothetical protein OR573_01235 [Halomonas sp. CH40]
MAHDTKVLKCRAPRTQQGQALTEFIIVSVFLLVPLFLMVPVIAKIISQKQDVEMGARYAAWERTVWYADAPGRGLDGYQGAALSYKSDQQIAKEVDSRIFAMGSQDISSEADAAFELDPFSRRQNGSQAALMVQQGESADIATVTSSNAEPGGIAGLADEVVDLISAVTQFDMPENGLVTASSGVQLMDLSDVFGDGLGTSLTLNATNAIYTESWSAGGRGHAEHRIQGLLPQQFLNIDLVDDAQDLLSAFPIADELHSDCLVLGQTTIEPLPAHRVAAFDGVTGGGGSSCDL